MNCSAMASTTAARLQNTVFACVLHGTVLAGVLAFVSATAAAESVAEFDDAAARLQYAFFTRDTRAIEELISLIEGYEANESLAATKAYDLAYGHWKLAQVHAGAAAQQKSTIAAAAARKCAQSARDASDLEERWAEAHALEAVCTGMPQGVFSIVGISGGACARSKPLRTALSLAPDNPRVLLIEALCNAHEAVDAATVERWKKVVEAFASAPVARRGTPDWGHAEALTLLGDTYLKRGDALAAREAIERALVLAPDYQTAQTLLEQAALQPRGQTQEGSR